MLLLTLLGEQPIPNLLPLWQYPEFSAVQFVVTPRTRPLAEALIAFIRQDHTLSHLQVIDPLEVEAYDLTQTRMRLSQALVSHIHAGLPVTLNLTGGTKLMSLAALQAAYGLAAPLLYVSSETGEMIFYSSDGVETRRENISVHISVEQYLHAHGIESSEVQNFNPETAANAARPPKEGDWLEEAVYQAAIQSGQFDDVRKNLYIRRRGRDDAVINELDVVVTRNGLLGVCSCKAGRKLSNDDLYELEALSSREKFGIYCGKVFVCAASEIPEGLKQRASADKIRLAFGDHVAQKAINQLLESLKRF